jgi:hypothetical protein
LIDRQFWAIDQSLNIAVKIMKSPASPSEDDLHEYGRAAVDSYAYDSMESTLSGKIFEQMMVNVHDFNSPL